MYLSKKIYTHVCIYKLDEKYQWKSKKVKILFVMLNNNSGKLHLDYKQILNEKKDELDENKILKLL